MVRLTPAVVHRSVGKPGFDEGICKARDCFLTFEHGSIDGPVGTLPAHIYEGALNVGTEDYPNTVSLPCNQAGSPIVLTLRLADDYRKIVVSGSRFSVQLEGEVKFVSKSVLECWRLL